MSSTWSDVVLVIALLAPVVAVGLTFVVALSDDDHRLAQGGCALAGVGAAVVLVAGQHPDVARLAPDDLALVAIIGLALLALSRPPDRYTPFVAVMVAVGGCGVSAGMPQRPSTIGPALAIAGVVVLAMLARELQLLDLAAIAGATVVAAAGVRVGGHGGAVAVVLGVSVAAALAAEPRRSIALVVPVALVLGLRVAPDLAGASAARATAVALGVGAVAVVALATVGRRPLLSPTAALIPWVLVAAIEPLAGTSVAARALAAAAVVAVSLGGSLARVAALPGTAVLAYAIADGSGWVRPVLALLAALTLAGVVSSAATASRVRIRPVDVLATALAGWLVVRPTAWTWLHISGVSAYEEGTAIAVAASLITGLVLAVQGATIEPEALSSWLVDDRDRTASRG